MLVAVIPHCAEICLLDSCSHSKTEYESQTCVSKQNKPRGWFIIIFQQLLVGHHCSTLAASISTEKCPYYMRQRGENWKKNKNRIFVTWIVQLLPWEQISRPFPKTKEKKNSSEGLNRVALKQRMSIYCVIYLSVAGFTINSFLF